MPQEVHMTEESYLKQKKENFKPQLLGQSFAGERRVDVRVGEPSFFYVVLENPNEKQPRTFTINFSCHNEKLKSQVKLVNSMNELEYWQTYGKIERYVRHEGRKVFYMSDDNLVESCALQNEIIVHGKDSVAVPFIVRSYKSFDFDQERI